MQNNILYRKDIDALKGIAIIAVVLYHMGLLSMGYLGVDVFFVINGFFVLPKAVDLTSWGGYFEFVTRRLLRLWPMVLLASLICLVVGYIGMLPDDYENLCQSIIASNFFSNNILQAITTKNYWDVVNDYKPLMHTWYLGILMEFYILFPLLMLILRKLLTNLNKDYHKTIEFILYVLCFFSLGLYLLPGIDFSDKFYYLPFRLFELIAGGIIALRMKELSNQLVLSSQATIASFLFLLFCLASGWLLPEFVVGIKLYILVVVVVLTCLLISSKVSHSLATVEPNLLCDLFVRFGKMSLSIYIWHQVILAFYRYFVTNNLSISVIALYWLAVIFLSLITYRFVERKLQLNLRSIIVIILLLIASTLPSLYIYAKAGVVRDVPELDIYKDHVHRGMFAEYSDRIYKFDKDFDSHEKINVFIIGNSFARDWANILLESKWKDSISISYAHDEKPGFVEKVRNRIGQADVIFINGSKKKVSADLLLLKRDNASVFGIGTKSYGESNGLIYTKRFTSDYFQTTVDAEDGIEEKNRALKKEWGDYYIDIMSYSRAEDGRIRVFTPDHKFISMDCRHLTQNGCKYYATIMNLDRYFVSK